MKFDSNLLKYLQSRFYNKSEVDNFISNISNFNTIEVEELPENGEKGVFYLLKNGEEDSNNLYDCYIFFNDSWELVGPHIDLDNYYVKSQIDSFLNSKAGLNVATETENGLMSKEDKTKIDGVEANANKTSVDSELSSISSNPVQNKTINSALNNKANSIHNHVKADITNFAHTHDDRYYTESEIDVLLNSKAGLSVATTSSNGLMSKEDKSKVDKSSHVEFNRNLTDGIKIGTLKIDEVDIDLFCINGDGEFIEYDVATTTTNGLMSKEDKVKLNGISSNADNVEFTRTLNAGTKIGAISIDGNSIDIFCEHTSIDNELSNSSENPVQNKTINSALSGKADTVHTHDDRYYTESEIDNKLSGKAGTSVATSSANGLLSSADKTKLDGIATGANKTVVDSSLSSSSTNPVQNNIITNYLSYLEEGVDNTLSDIQYSLLDKADNNHSHGINDITNLQNTLNNKAGTSVVTTSANGLMSKEDKVKLDSIATGANKTIVDSALSSSSTNPVQNKVVNSALSGKANSSHNHNDLYYTESEVDGLINTRIKVVTKGRITANKNDISGSVDFCAIRIAELNILILSDINLKFTSTTSKTVTQSYAISDRVMNINLSDYELNWRTLGGMNNSQFLIRVNDAKKIELRMMGTVNQNMAYGDAIFVGWDGLGE